MIASVQNQPIRVMHIITGLGTGGAEMMLYKVSRALRAYDITSHVVSLSGTDALRPHFVDEHIPVTTIDFETRGAAPLRLLQLASCARRVRPQVIQGWLPHGNLAALIASAGDLKRVPVAWNVRQSLDLERARDSKRTTASLIQLGGRLSWWPDAIVYNSRTGMGQHQAIGYRSRPGITIPNGFDLDRFKPSATARADVRAELQLPPDTVLIGLIARYHPMKDHDTFLRAAARLIAHRADVRFVLAGHGVDVRNTDLEKRIADLGLVRQVYLLGERHDVPRITAALDIATSSSRTLEGFPNTVGEAMACGVPCVVTDVGDSAFIVGDTGTVVPPSAPGKLAAAWEAFLAAGSQERARLGVAARKRVESCYSVDAVARMYASLYQRLAHA